MTKEKPIVDASSAALSYSTVNEVTLFDLWRVVWGGKYLIVLITGLFTAIAVVYALFATEWYRADALLVPADGQSMSEIDSQLGGLASLAGFRLGGGSGDSSEAIAILRSRAFAREFILEFELISIFLQNEENSKEQPDIRDAIEFFHKNVLRVSENRDTGHVTLSVTWTDAGVAAEWANILVKRINERMRERAAKSAEENIKFLKSEMATNSLVDLEQSISRLMETEMKELMLVRGNEEYAFRVIDGAEPPRVRSRPRRSLLVVSVFFVSGILSLLVVFVFSAVRKSRLANQTVAG